MERFFFLKKSLLSRTLARKKDQVWDILSKLPAAGLDGNEGPVYCPGTDGALSRMEVVFKEFTLAIDKGGRKR